MVSGNSKRIVVIRDIPSNIIEEAILVLKGEPGGIADIAVKGTAGKDRKDGKGKKRQNDLLIKEAEMIINNYIKECKNRGVHIDETIGRKRGLLKPKLPVNTLINIAMAAGIALLVFLLTRFI